ncbi:MAG: ABC transporter ATP-binding protein [Myxococcales bacterium]|nr:MAG: ABC transporter ATP-binding protein [Myxococcales bacterium]
MSAPVLDITALTKTYGDRDVVHELSFAVAAGEAVALIGRNGTGKSTVLRCVVGTEEPTQGEIRLLGREIDERSPATRSALAVVMDDIDFFPDLSVVEHLDLFAAAHGVRDAEALVDDVLHEVGLINQSGQLPGTLSSGQKHRLGLASAFVRPRQLLILDEPEQRLDTQGVDWLKERLAREKQDGLAVLFASHEPALVEAVADRVVSLD